MTATNHSLWKTSLAFAKTDQRLMLFLLSVKLLSLLKIHIDRDMLFSVLNIRTKAPKITSLLNALYTETKASIKNTVNSFQVHTGCRQE